MSVRNFWTVFLKILGIWLVIGGVTTVLQFLSAFSYIGTYNLNSWNILSTIGLLLLTISVYIFALWLFVFKTSWLIDKLQLEKGFQEEKIEFNIQRSSVITIATIVIGGLIFVDSLPQFCRQTFIFFQQKSMLVENPTTGWIIFHFIKTVIGYLLMTNSKYVVRFIEKQNKE
jgi:hypothetical protein